MTGIMSIRQLITYRVLLSGLTVLWNEAPEGIKWNGEISRKLKISTRSYRFYLGKLMAKLPDTYVTMDPRKNKLKLKKWIMDNIPPREKWDGLGEYDDESDSDD